MHRHSAQLTVTPTSIGKRLVTYSVYSYAFLGGAHGNYATTYVNYDVEKGQVLTVGRVFADVQGLKTAIMRELQLKPEYAGSLLVDKVPTVSNFYIEGALITSSTTRMTLHAMLPATSEWRCLSMRCANL